ncbi:FkbM family methyltransferase [Pantanalinema rosaneae CENA516]|uniref:FkbM family methyltransferase n=1 Tax=Pantanalinema rosaneae TaxID=1620701 RepID=UPI003D6DF491
MEHPVLSQFQDQTSKVVPPEFCVDYLGVVRRRSYIHSDLEEILVPQLDNEEYFEWIDILESVVLAQDRFTMIELGAGFGRWLVRAAVAMQQYAPDLPVKLIGVEAEPTHFQWMQQHFRDNGINPDDHLLVEAAVDEQDGEVLFHVGKPDEWYGQAIAPDATSQSLDTVQTVRSVSLNQILAQVDGVVDLVDVDVQGSEFLVFRSAMTAMNRQVKRVHISTHTTDIERELRLLFRQHGWHKLNDFACLTTEQTEWGEVAFGDGVQTWMNPRLSPIHPSHTAWQRSQLLLTNLERKCYQLEVKLDQQQQEHQQLQVRLHSEQGLLNQLRQENAQLLVQWQQSQSQSAQIQGDFTQALCHCQAEVNQLRTRIAAMESSKFWQLRTAWIRFKRTLGLKAD